MEVPGRGWHSVTAVPRIAQRAGAGVGLRAGGKLAVELGEQGPARRETQFGAGRGRAPNPCGIGAPLTVKLAPGSAWNSRAQRRVADAVVRPGERPRRISGMPATSVGCIEPAPSSVRMSVAFMAL